MSLLGAKCSLCRAPMIYGARTKPAKNVTPICPNCSLRAWEATEDALDKKTQVLAELVNRALARARKGSRMARDLEQISEVVADLVAQW